MHAVSELEILHSMRSDFYFSDLAANPKAFFPHLRRLVLGSDTALSGDAASYRLFFSPAYLPVLSHLALDCIDPYEDRSGLIYADLLPQLSTLALSDESFHKQRPSLLRRLNGIPNRLHLSIFQIDRRSASFDLFLSEATDLRLGSLHVSSTMLNLNNNIARQLCDIANGKTDRIKIPRIVLYGSKEEFTEELDFPELVDLEWRTGPMPPFADFDGR
jgi:hypothetical protein